MHRSWYMFLEQENFVNEYNMSEYLYSTLERMCKIAYNIESNDYEEQSLKLKHQLMLGISHELNKILLNGKDEIVNHNIKWQDVESSLTKVSKTICDRLWSEEKVARSYSVMVR